MANQQNDEIYWPILIILAFFLFQIMIQNEPPHSLESEDAPPENIAAP